MAANTTVQIAPNIVDRVIAFPPAQDFFKCAGFNKSQIIQESFRISSYVCTVRNYFLEHLRLISYY